MHLWRALTHTHTRMQTHTHTCRHTRKRMDTHTHTSTYTSAGEFNGGEKENEREDVRGLQMKKRWMKKKSRKYWEDIQEVHVRSRWSGHASSQLWHRVVSGSSRSTIARKVSLSSLWVIRYYTHDSDFIQTFPFFWSTLCFKVYFFFFSLYEVD